MRHGAMVAADADLPFHFLVVWRQVLIANWPIGQGAAFGHAVLAGHAEVLRHKAPGLSGVNARPAAHAGGVVLIPRLVRAQQAQIAQRSADWYRKRIGLERARITFNIRSRIVAVDGHALVAQVIAAHGVK